MEQEQHQWIVHDHEQEEEEESEDTALKRRQFFSHSKDNLITCVVVSSSSSSTGNGGEHSNRVCSVATDPDRSPVQKEEQVAEMGSIGEDGIHFNNDKVDYAVVGLGLVAEFVGAATNGEVITGATFSAAVSQNKNSVYFDKQEVGETQSILVFDGPLTHVYGRRKTGKDEGQKKDGSNEGLRVYERRRKNEKEEHNRNDSCQLMNVEQDPVMIGERERAA